MTIADLAGPLVVLTSLPAGECRVIVCTEDGRLHCKSVTEVGMVADGRGQWCPTDVAQVLVGQTLVPGKVSLKTATKKYLCAHPSGKVVATRDAVGPTEEWRPRKVDGGFVWQDVFDRHLSVSAQDEAVWCETREEITPSEIFRVHCQRARKPASTETAASKGQVYTCSS